MLHRLFLVASLILSLALTTRTFASQGLTCSNFREFSKAEQLRYLEGYTLGAAMELSYFKHNVLTANVDEALRQSDNELLQSVSQWGIEYLKNKYNLINIAKAYPSEFHKAVQHECELTHNLEVGMFDVLPSTLEKMKETGKYRVWGM